MKTGSNGMSLMPDTTTEPKDGDMTDKTSDIGNCCVRSIYIYNYIMLYIINYFVYIIIYIHMSIDRVDQQKWGCQQACVIADKSKVAAMTLGICCELMRSHGIAKAKGWAYNKQESNHCRFEEKQLGSLQVISLSLSPLRSFSL